MNPIYVRPSLTPLLLETAPSAIALLLVSVLTVLVVGLLAFMLGRRADQRRKSADKQSPAFIPGQVSNDELFKLPVSAMSAGDLRKTRLYLLGAFLVGLLMLGYTGWQTYHVLSRVSRFESGGASTLARVTENYLRRGSRYISSANYISYEYQVAGQTYRQREMVSDLRSKQLKAGEQVQVVYLEANPAEAMLAWELSIPWHTRPEIETLYWALAAGLAISLISLFFSARARKTERFYRGDAITTSGTVVGFGTTAYKNNLTHWLVYQFEDQTVRQEITPEIKEKLTPGMAVRVRYLQADKKISRAG